MTSRPRLRFAPSPTGYLHVGGARTTLYNWIYARQHDGELLLRIEDTDAERNRPELTDNILDMIRWLGLEWDGDPVHQSDRAETHRAAAEKLAASGAAYYCDCTTAAIQARAKERGGPQGYDGHCRDRGLGPGPGAALRFRTPDEGVTSFSDVVRGEVRFENAHLEDFVIQRSNGTVTFLLANAVDDSDMEITHVLRAEEHLNGTPKYLLLCGALDLAPPSLFAHLPMLVNERRQKLSKRRDSVSVADFMAQGYLPEAMLNYLALLGWGPPDGKEIRPLAEIVEFFRLEDVTPSPAFFDVQKLTHFNGEYIRALPTPEFLTRADPYLTQDDTRQALHDLGELVQERVTTLGEIEGYLDFFWRDEPALHERDWQKAMSDERAPAMLDAAIDRLDACEWDATAVRAAIEEASTTAGYTKPDGSPQLAKSQAPIRVAVTGRMQGPPLFESLVVLGKEPTLARLRAAQARLS